MEDNQVNFWRQFRWPINSPQQPEEDRARAGLHDARTWARPFFHWYNHEHRHTSLGLMTPATVHYDQAAELRVKRQAVLAAAYEKHPERFVQGQPVAPHLPTAVWINPPLERDGM